MPRPMGITESGKTGHGGVDARVNALWHGHFPIIFAPCESLDPDALKWLLDHGANPNCRDPRQSAAGHPYPGTALDYLIASYARSPND